MIRGMLASRKARRASLFVALALAACVLLLLPQTSPVSLARSSLGPTLSPAHFGTDALPRLAVDRLVKGLQRHSDFLVNTSATKDFAAVLSQCSGKFLGSSVFRFTGSEVVGTEGVRTVTGRFELRLGKVGVADDQASFTVVLTNSGWRVSDAPFLALAVAKIGETAPGESNVP